jgi:16S rRNA (uracil1498-N3)-methyltransferase
LASERQLAGNVSKLKGSHVNLILLDPNEANDAGHVSLSDARAAHLLNVLKVAPEHQVRLGVLDGPGGIGVVESIGDGMVHLRCAFDTTVPSRPRVDLLLALPRPKVMRRLWAQIAALGVGQIILTNAERVERNYFDTHVLTAQCYRPLLIEGLQQARDTRLPLVSVHRQFKVLVEDELDGLFGSGLRLVADPAATNPASVVVKESDERILLAVGPEGGWNAFETALLGAHGFQPIGMGPRTLRSDTACVALLALTHAALGRPEGRPLRVVEGGGTRAHARGDGTA